MTTVNVKPIEPRRRGNHRPGFQRAKLPEGTVLSISPGLVTGVLVGLALALALASTAGQIAKYLWGVERAFGLIPAFHLDHENNIPAWYATILLWLSAMLLAAIAWGTRAAGGRYVAHWRLLSLMFVFFSLDEAAGIHEKFIIPLRTLLHTSGLLYQAWVLPAMVLVLIVGVSYLKFVAALPSRTRWLIVAAGTLYVAGALGMEMVSGAYASEHGVWRLEYAMLTTVEEVLEMLGVVLFIHALLGYIASLSIGACVAREGAASKAGLTAANGRGIVIPTGMYVDADHCR